MELPTRPLFALYVVWHPLYADGREIADRLRAHYSRDLFQTMSEGASVSVLERSESVRGASTPLPIDWDDAELTAVIVLADSTMASDGEWSDYVRNVARSAQTRGLPASFFLVTMESKRLALGVGNKRCAGTNGRNRIQSGVDV